MTSVWKRIMAAIWSLGLAYAVAPLGSLSAHADLGDTVTNIVTISYDLPDGRFQFQSNTAEFMIEARATPSQIEFFRIAPSASDATIVQLNGAEFSESGAVEGPFVPIEEFSGTGSQSLSMPFQTPIVPADIYLSGEPIVIRVTDEGQNGNPNVTETLVATVATNLGDQITLRLFEDSPDSGQFYGVFPSTGQPSLPNDDTLSAPRDTILTATYIDRFDETEISIDTALVDPFGRVFDSFTGAFLNNIRVTLVDALTGEPAEVFGVDGVSAYPSTILTGSRVTDASGAIYVLENGEFIFPLVVPGDYRLVVESTEDYAFPSQHSESELAGLNTAPFEIIDGSYGEVFTVTATGPLNLDVPLDPSGELSITKTASELQASVGDFVGYTINLENTGTVAAPYNLVDTLPIGLRYITGSARIDGAKVDDPVISPDGQVIGFQDGVVLPGTPQRLTYLTVLGPGTPNGTAVNAAVAVNSGGAAISNVAEADIFVEEDLLQSTLTIAGRVVEAACEPDEPWARAIEDGTGIAGVRLYMETGRYVVTDEDGLYHFEGVEPGTHVVQVDKATLPEGYTPVICEENTRYAGTAISKFVDAQGGTIWRANFYLKATEAARAALTEPEAAKQEAVYDQVWLNGQTDPDPAWIYPLENESPRGRSVDIGLRHGPNQKITLFLNGRETGSVNFAGRELSQTRSVAMSRWTGIDIQRGENTLIAEIRNEAGDLVASLERKVWFVDEVHAAALVDDQTQAVADGRTKPVIAIRLENAAGRAVHEGRIVDISVAAPYRLAQAAEQEFEAPLSTAANAITGVRVGENGIASVELEPTLQAGRVRLSVKLHDDRREIIDVWLSPEKREWVVVGLLEAEGLLSDLDAEAKPEASKTSADGRLALFAKGVVKGDWLLTVAIDTAKRRGSADGEIFDEIDPNAYYTLYGDRTWQRNDAESRYPVYVKLERNTFQALFGDYETDLNDTELGRYSRRLSGLKVDYEGKRASVTAFAAETNQSFQKDEIAADGTSGPYRLSRAPLIRSSEVITVETRSRFRPDDVLDVLTLSRFIDYDIDYVTGEVIFRSPVAASDSELNPNVIVVDYETSETVSRGLTAGGRAALYTEDRRLEGGVTVLREEDGNSVDAGASELVSLDTTLQVSPATQIYAEVATSRSSDDTTAEAYVLETIRSTQTTTFTGYFREEKEGFGLGQQASNTSATRRIGASLSAELGVSETQDGNDRSVRRIDGQAYREENLTQGSRRDVGEISLSQDSQTFGMRVGFRGVSEEYDDTGEERTAGLFTVGAHAAFVDLGLTLSASHDQPIIGGEKRDSVEGTSLFAERTVLGLDKTLGRRASLSVRHEITTGENASGDNTVAGIDATPWAGGQVFASADQITQDGAQRLGATVGVDQAWQINRAWSASGGLTRRTKINGDQDPRDVTPDDAVGIFEDGLRSDLVGDDNYTSAYLGAGYRADNTALSGRIEHRDSDTEKRLVLTAGGAREVSETLSFSAAARLQRERPVEAPNSRTLDIRIGAAWRPRGEGPIILNRFDVGHDKVDGQSLTTKAVNNLTLNTQLTKTTQASVYHGIKYVETEFEGSEESGFTHLIGGELRHDLSTKLDLGLHGFLWTGDASQTSSWALGPSVGFTPSKNMWMSLGWNIEGFDDEDFEAARYTNHGPFVKFRAKFDQDSVKALIRNLGLGAE